MTQGNKASGNKPDATAMAMMMAMTVAIAACLAGCAGCVASETFHPPPAPHAHLSSSTTTHYRLGRRGNAVADGGGAPSLEHKQLLAWQALFDMMRTKTPSSSTTGRVDTAAGGGGGGGCEGTCTSRDDPCSCSYMMYVRCSDNRTALTYLDIGQCHVTGKQQGSYAKCTRNDERKKKQNSVCTCLCCR